MRLVGDTALLELHAAVRTRLCLGRAEERAHHARGPEAEKLLGRTCPVYGFNGFPRSNR